MYRRILACLMLLLLLPAAMAGELSPYEVFTFAGRLPAELQEPLSALIPDESQVISGAAIRYNGGHYSDAPDYLDAYTALVLVNADDGLRLYAAARVEGLPWQVNDYSRFLRQGDGVSISIYQPENTRVPVFSVDYARPEGLMSDLFSFWGNRLWSVYAHMDQARGVTVKNERGSVRYTEGDVQKDYACLNLFDLDYMADMTAFPVTREAAEKLTIAYETASAKDTAANRVYADGANLRKEPTGSSESLGKYAVNVPMTFTGETKPGTSWPWYQVRIGDTLGWMSSNYVTLSPNGNASPVPLGRTAEGSTLYADPEGAQAISQLAPGVTFHVLTETNGMYHICIPQNEISWAVDADGTYGYIPKDGVPTGYSPSALDALENAR